MNTTLIDFTVDDELKIDHTPPVLHIRSQSTKNEMVHYHFEFDVRDIDTALEQFDVVEIVVEDPDTGAIRTLQGSVSSITPGVCTVYVYPMWHSDTATDIIDKTVTATADSV